jgi:[acyl-carrier-protein] S-malonyltransferase
MARVFMEVDANPAQIPLIANVLASPISNEKEIIKHLVEQVTGSVRWRETMNFMHSEGITDIYELGAGKVLSGMVKRGYKDINSSSVCTPLEIEELAKNL